MTSHKFMLNQNNRKCYAVSVVQMQIRKAKYLEDWHQKCLDGFAFVEYSLTSNFKTTNLLWINTILLQK